MHDIPWCLDWNLYRITINHPWQSLKKQLPSDEAEAPILWSPDVESWLTGKNPDAGKDWGQEEKGVTEDKMVGWHHSLNGHGFEQTWGDSEGQEAWCAAVYGVTKSWTQLSDWNELNWTEGSELPLLIQKCGGEFDQEREVAKMWPGKSRQSTQRWDLAWKPC